MELWPRTWKVPKRSDFLTDSIKDPDLTAQNFC